MWRERRLAPRPPCDFGLTASVFARFPAENVDLYRDGVYSRLLELGGRLVVVEVRAQGGVERPSLELRVGGDSTSDADLAEAERTVGHIFTLDAELEPFYVLARSDPVLGRLVDRFRGLRLATRPGLFETLVSAITTQQINLTFAYTLRARLVEGFGRSLVHDGRRYYAFPTTEGLARASVPELRRLQYSERKAGYILDLARQVASGELRLDELTRLPDEEFIAAVTRVRGLGRWSAEWALSRGLGRPDVIAADDLGVQRAVSRYYLDGQRVTSQQVRELAARWAGHRSYAIHYLLTALYHRVEP